MAFSPNQRTDASLLVVNDLGHIAELAKQRYPHVDICSRPNCLSGIAACTPDVAGPVSHVLVGVEPGFDRLPAAVGGLRRAVGGKARVVLCCRPAGEPAARRALEAGADDYVIYPPSGQDLDQALKISTPGRWIEVPSGTARQIDPAELSRLAEVLSSMEKGRRHVLEEMASLLRASLQCRDLTIVTANAQTEAGPAGSEPVLAETIEIGGRKVGQIIVGPREGLPFGAGDMEKLRHYACLVGHLLDACDRRDSLEQLALTDELTGMPNRRHFTQKLDATLQRAARDRTHVTLLMFDLDDFKHFNDTYGHAAGDEILREAGRLFRTCCRQHDVVARYGGDEFAVMFWEAEEPRVAGSKHPRDVLMILNRFRKALEAHRFESLGPEAEGALTISGGLATFPWDAQRAVDLVEQADQALLRAKRDGKNRIYLVGSDTSVSQDAEGGPSEPF
ncbi:MAG: GGDEF domain-containing protein [Phycisphaerae bacterium]|nr:GGDEF domain-containing protein [Phycisphaerae bacterium]